MVVLGFSANYFRLDLTDREYGILIGAGMATAWLPVILSAMEEGDKNNDEEC